MSGEPRALIEIKELEHAKNLRYDVTRDGGRVVVWCTDSVPFPNLVVVDIMSQNKISVYCHEGLVRQVGQQLEPGGGVYACNTLLRKRLSTQATREKHGIDLHEFKHA